MTQQNVNFLPEDYVEKRAAQRSAFLFIGLFIVVMGAIVAAYLLPEQKLRAAVAERDRVNQQYEEAGKRLSQLQEMEREKQRMMMKAEVTAVLLERVPRSVLLAEYTRLMPKGVSFLTLELKSKEQAAPARAGSRLDAAKQAQDVANGVAEPPRPVQPEVIVGLTGMAPTDEQVAAFMAALDKSQLVRDLNLQFSEEYSNQGTTMRKFKVEMKLNPEADIKAMAAQKAAR